ncbi:teneurin-4 [Ditylenchus destructor]|uniref:Teneurin-4 n=1 Tax=Ditylenchus destructor TaxID=166010 RepID=A0AAD4RD68_9BILA|nr:teneurin-4 [Ditylenchus destructor]
MYYIRSSSHCGCNPAQEAIVETVGNVSEQNIPGHVFVIPNTQGNFVISKNAQMRNNVLAMEHATALHKLIHVNAILLIMETRVKMSTQLSKIVIEETVPIMATALAQMRIQIVNATQVLLVYDVNKVYFMPLLNTFIGLNPVIAACNDKDQCNGHGKCEGTTQHFTCSCNNGYSGNNCEIADLNVIPCERSDCHDHGKCEGVKAKFSCKCDNGYVGNTCADTPCDNGACNGHGKCIGTSSNFNCSCDNGWLYPAMEAIVITTEVAVERKTALLVLVIRVSLAVDVRIKIVTIKLTAMVTELALEQYKMQLASAAKAIQAIVAKMQITMKFHVIEAIVTIMGIVLDRRIVLNVVVIVAFREIDAKEHSALHKHNVTLTARAMEPLTAIHAHAAQVTPCDRSDCSEHGNCTGMKSAPKCTCDSGRTGTHCEKETPCDSSDCSNHGTCTGSKANPTCTCGSGYCGSKCGDSCGSNNNNPTNTPTNTNPGNSNSCEQSLCNNAGVCIGTAQNFTCQCISGWSGPRCTNRFSGQKCQFGPGGSTGGVITGSGCLGNGSQQCSGNGQCIVLNNQFICACFNGWTGPLCGTQVILAGGNGPGSTTNGGTGGTSGTGGTVTLPNGTVIGGGSTGTSGNTGTGGNSGLKLHYKWFFGTNGVVAG